MRKRQDLLDNAIKVLKKSRKSDSAIVLIYDNDNQEYTFLWKGICSHEISEVFHSAIETVEKDELEEEKRETLRELKKEEKKNRLPISRRIIN